MGFKEIAMQRDLQRPLARKTDPASSKAAAEHVVESGKLEGQCQQVYEALKRFPNHTAREISKASGLDYHMVAKRLPVLRDHGRARVVGTRICTESTTGIKTQYWEAL